MKVSPKPTEFNSLPLWRVARETELRALPLPARRIANQFGLDATTARLIASLAGLSMEAGMTSDICGAASPLLSDPSEGMILDDRTIRWLLRQGVPVGSIGSPLAVRSARVAFDRSGGRYWPSALGEFALVVPVPADPATIVTDLGAVDLVAWSPKSGQDRHATRECHRPRCGAGARRRLRHDRTADPGPPDADQLVAGRPARPCRRRLGDGRLRPLRPCSSKPRTKIIAETSSDG